MKFDKFNRTAAHFASSVLTAAEEPRRHEDNGNTKEKGFTCSQLNSISDL